MFSNIFYGKITMAILVKAVLQIQTRPARKISQAMTGHFGRFSSVANRVWIINMPAAFMRQTHKWPSKMPGMFIQEEMRASVSG